MLLILQCCQKKFYEVVRKVNERNAYKFNSPETMKDYAISVAFFARIHCDYIDPMWIFWPKNIERKGARAVRAKTHNWMLKNACQLIRLVVVPFFFCYSFSAFTTTTSRKIFDAGRFFSFYWTHNICFLCAKWLRKI